MYVPTNRDIELFPNLSTTRITEVDEGPTEEHDTNLAPDLKREEWWTGRSLFPLPGHSGEQIRHALASSKGKQSRSKAEAKREARELKFKGTDTICKEPTPSMEKAVNVMTYDMRDFWSPVLKSIVTLRRFKSNRWQLSQLLSQRTE